VLTLLLHRVIFIYNPSSAGVETVDILQGAKTMVTKLPDKKFLDEAFIYNKKNGFHMNHGRTQNGK
jgi:hypothetical protein